MAEQLELDLDLPKPKVRIGWQPPETDHATARYNRWEQDALAHIVCIITGDESIYLFSRNRDGQDIVYEARGHAMRNLFNTYMMPLAQRPNELIQIQRYRKPVMGDWYVSFKKETDDQEIGGGLIIRNVVGVSVVIDKFMDVTTLLAQHRAHRNAK